MSKKQATGLAHLNAALNSMFTPAPAAKPAKAPQATAKQTITAKLDDLFDAAGGPAVLCLSFAQDLAVAHGLNRTSAGIRLYRYLALRAQQSVAAPQERQAA